MKRRLVFQVSGFTALVLLAAAPSQAQTSSVTEEQARLQCMQQFANMSTGPSDLVGLLTPAAGASVADIDQRIETCVQAVLKTQSLAQAEEQKKQDTATLKTQQCTAATQGLQSKGQLSNVQTLVKNDCAILYTMKWLTGGTGKTNVTVCQPPWLALSKAQVVKFARAYVALRCGQ
jgi:hypothetical protein